MLQKYQFTSALKNPRISHLEVSIRNNFNRQNLCFIKAYTRK